MNRKELIDAIAERSGVSKVSAAQQLEATMDVIKSVVASGDTLTLVGFGTFKLRERAARSGRNPRTGESVQVGASRTPAFKPSSAFKALANPKSKAKGAAKKK